ncbi:MAG: hypothetical protein ACRC62_07970 [Microcoleus sp.]
MSVAIVFGECDRLEAGFDGIESEFEGLQSYLESAIYWKISESVDRCLHFVAIVFGECDRLEVNELCHGISRKRANADLEILNQLKNNRASRSPHTPPRE